MSTEGVAVIREIGPGGTSASGISHDFRYQDGAVAGLVVGAGGRPAAVTEPSPGVGGLDMGVLGVGDRGYTGPVR